jgi:Subtilase family
MSDEVFWSDPYANWLPLSQDSSAAGNNRGRQMLQAFDGDLVPLVVQLKDTEEAQKWWDLIYKKIGFVQRRLGSKFLSLLIARDKLKDLLVRFEAENIRWEIGSPFTSTAGFYSSGDGSAVSQTEEGFDGKEKVKEKPITSKKKKILGIIDYGCAFAHEKFCSTLDSRKTRVFAIWDQQSRVDYIRSRTDSRYKQLSWRPTTRYGYGYETFRDSDQTEKIQVGMNEFIAQFNDPLSGFNDELCYEYANYEAIYKRHATHGTYIMDFAAGMPNPLEDIALDPTNEWVANGDSDMSDTDIVFVQLPRIVNGETVSGVLRTFVLDAIMYILRCASTDADVVINISYGGMAGPHDGSSVVEQAIDDLIAAERYARKARKDEITEIVICAGNTRASDMHSRQVIGANSKAEITLSVIPDNPTLQFVEMWFDSTTVQAVIEIVLPSGKSATQGKPIRLNQNSLQLIYDDLGKVVGQICSTSNNGSKAKVLIGLNPSLSYSSSQQATVCPVGDWRIVVNNESDGQLQWNAWCERSDPIFGSGHGPRQIKFSDCATPIATLNNLASGSRTVIVGGMVLNAAEFMAEYSSQGPDRGEQHMIANNDSHIDPSVIYAPSEENLAYWALPGAGVLGQTKVRFSGTSVAAAVVSRQLMAGKTPAQLRAYKKPTEIRNAFG